MSLSTPARIGTLELYWKSGKTKQLVISNPDGDSGQPVANDPLSYTLAATISTPDPDEVITMIHSRMSTEPNFGAGPAGVYSYRKKDQQSQKHFVDTLFRIFRSYDVSALEKHEEELFDGVESSEVQIVADNNVPTINSRILLIKNKAENLASASFVVLPAEAHQYNANQHEIIEQVNSIHPDVPLEEWKRKLETEMTSRQMDGIEGNVPFELQEEVAKWMQAYYDYDRCDPAYRKKRMFQISQKHCGINPRLFVMKVGTTEFIQVSDISTVAPGDRIKFSAYELTHMFGGFLPHEKKSSRKFLDILCQKTDFKDKIVKHSSGERLISWEDMIGFGLRYFNRGYAPGIYARRNQFTMMGDNGHVEAVRQVVNNARFHNHTVDETPEMRNFMEVEDPEAGSAANCLLPNELPVERIVSCEERIAILNHDAQIARIRAAEIEQRTVHISANAAAAATLEASKYNTDRVVEQQAKRDADEVNIKSLKLIVTNRKIEAETKLTSKKESLMERELEVRVQEANAVQIKSQNDLKISDAKREATKLRLEVSKEVSSRRGSAGPSTEHIPDASEFSDDDNTTVDFVCPDPKCKGVKGGPTYKKRKLYHDTVSACKQRSIIR